MTLDGATLREAIETVKPSLKSPSLPAAVRTGQAQIMYRPYVSCPRCDAYALGLELKVGFRFRNKAGEELTVDDLQDLFNS